MAKTAVVLMNLGGPAQEADIKPFLFNFFMDKNIISLPLLLRFLLAKWISAKRSKGAAHEAYGRLGYKSPLLENTQKQAKALQEILGGDFKVFVSMRYWHPLAQEVAAQIKEYNPEKIILLPLYPQYSTATTKSSFEDFPIKDALTICCYPLLDGFISASVDNIKKELGKAPPKTRVLFSAHGLPEKTIRAGDPYQWQCEKSAEAIAKAAGIRDWQICYQSRVGPLKWIGPSVQEALQKATQDGVGIVIYPHAFVSEHVETLVELDIEYKELAKNLGVPYFARAQTVGTHPDFIKGLSALVLSRLNGQECARICPQECGKCPCKG